MYYIKTLMIEFPPPHVLGIFIPPRAGDRISGLEKLLYSMPTKLIRGLFKSIFVKKFDTYTENCT